MGIQSYHNPSPDDRRRQTLLLGLFARSTPSGRLQNVRLTAIAYALWYHSEMLLSAKSSASSGAWMVRAAGCERYEVFNVRIFATVGGYRHLRGTNHFLLLASAMGGAR